MAQEPPSVNVVQGATVVAVLDVPRKSPRKSPVWKSPPTKPVRTQDQEPIDVSAPSTSLPLASVVSLEAFLQQLDPPPSRALTPTTDYLEKFAAALEVAGKSAGDPVGGGPLYDKDKAAELMAEAFPLVEVSMMSAPLLLKQDMSLLQVALKAGVPELVARVMYLSQHQDDWNSAASMATKNALLSRPDRAGNTLLHTLFELAQTRPQTAYETLLTFFLDPVYFAHHRRGLAQRLVTHNLAGQSARSLTTNVAFLAAVNHFFVDEVMSLNTLGLMQGTAGARLAASTLPEAEGGEEGEEEGEEEEQVDEQEAEEEEEEGEAEEGKGMGQEEEQEQHKELSSREEAREEARLLTQLSSFQDRHVEGIKGSAPTSGELDLSFFL